MPILDVRDLYHRGILTIEHLVTDKMPADIFTKPLPYVSFIAHRNTLLNPQ